MLKKRIIPILTYSNEELVKSIQFGSRKYIGDPLNAVRIFNEKFVDEIILLDIGNENRDEFKINYPFLKKLLNECFMPVTYGGGIKTFEDAKKIFDLGVDKISLNSIIFKNVEIIEKLVSYFGSQSIVACFDIKKNISGKYCLYNYKENKIFNYEFKQCIQKIIDLGIGEILINSVDRDGMMNGVEKDLLKDLNFSVPLIYSGGVGKLEDLQDGFKYKLEGIGCSSFFCFYGENKSVLISYPFKDLDKVR